MDNVDRPSGGRLALGRYALSEPVAYGGMATIFLARLHGPLGFCRPVAVKRLHPPFARDPHFVSMLLDEARLCAFVRHPNVVQVLDLVAQDGELWVVLEHVLGASLRELCAAKQEPMAPSVACAVMRDVLLGLHAAHEARGGGGEHLGIVHRDVSPHNVLLGADGIARLTDFGIARAAWRAQSTESGQLKGKLAYMSPEQLGSGPIDRRSDLYAASILFWELLTGERLFQSSEPADVLSRETLRIEPPSSRRAGLPAGLDEVVLRGLQPDPADRFDTAQGMLEALERGHEGGRTDFASRQQVGAWLLSQAPALLAEREAALHRVPSAAGGPVAEVPAATAYPADEDTYVGHPEPAGPAARSAPARRWPLGVVGLVTVVLVLVGSTGFQSLRNLAAGETAGAAPPTATHGPEQGASRPANGDARAAAGPTGAQNVSEALPTPQETGADRADLTDPRGGASEPVRSGAPTTPGAAAIAPSGPGRGSVTDPTNGSRRSTAERPRPAASDGRASPASRPGCDPPFEIDAEGIKRFKEQCL